VSEIVNHGSFYTHDGVVYVPTSPEGTIELRVQRGVVEVKQYRFDRPGFPYPNENRLVATVRVPVVAVTELLK
jgi:hypothetical protein